MMSMNWFIKKLWNQKRKWPLMRHVCTWMKTLQTKNNSKWINKNQNNNKSKAGEVTHDGGQGFNCELGFFSLPLSRRCLWVCPPPPKTTTKHTQDRWSNTGWTVVQLHTVLSLSPVVWLCVGLPQGPEDCGKQQQWYQHHSELCWWWPLKMRWLQQQACPVDPLHEFGTLSWKNTGKVYIYE